MLSLFDAWKEKTNGALDASSAVASQLWRNAAAKNEIPTKLNLRSAVEEMQQKHYLLNAENLTATRLDNSPLVMNSFAKSYIIHKATE